MTTVYDVPSEDLIKTLAKKLKDEKIVSTPEANVFSRTGVHKENPPENKDWWYVRCASILRKVYMMNIVGVEHLRDEYGGARDKGSKPYKARSGSGTIIRRALQQLEKAGYITKVKGKGRMLTAKGRSLLDNTANDVKKEVESYIPELKKY